MWLRGKESACQCRRPGFSPRVGKIPWRRKWQPTVVLLPEKPRGQRSLVGYSPRGHIRVVQDLVTKQQFSFLGQFFGSLSKTLRQCLPTLWKIFKKFCLPFYVFAAATKSPQSCLTLCDPIDGSPPGSSVLGILQARILEWVALSFSNACMHAKSLQSCPTSSDPMDCSPPGSSVLGILQARVLVWGAIAFSGVMSNYS